MITTTEMGDAVTQGQFFQAMEQQRKDFDERHKNMRVDMQEGFEKIRDLIAVHNERDQAVERRVQRIEDRIKYEAEESTRRNGLQTVGIASLLMIAWEILKRKILGWNQ